MFSDRVRVFLAAGKGGDGASAMRREKWVPRGGPSGGDGGAGGDIVLVAGSGLRDLTALRFHPHVRAGLGKQGEGSLKTGADGDDEIVPVPVGTQVLDEDGAVVADLAHAGARVVIARGGRGGRGNARFTSSTRQAPRIAEIGEEGEERELVLHLKLLADAALLGFPNVGKSSLLRRISNATPKVANYPFTTIQPVLGTVDGPDDGEQLTVVDVPGLLEGAAEGIGLGHDFLAHLERARMLLHVVDAGQTLEEARAGFGIIHAELAAHGHGLADRDRIVVLNRIDLVPPDERAALIDGFRDAIAADGLPADVRVVRDDDGTPVVVPTSCSTGEGIDGLLAALFRYAPARGAVVVGEAELADYLVFKPGRPGERTVRLLREEGVLRIVGATDLEPLVEAADREDDAAVLALDAALEARGILRALRRAGVRHGQEVRIGGTAFIYEREADPE